MATIDKNIQLNSPFKFVHSEAGLTKATLSVWIYTGTQGAASGVGVPAIASNDRLLAPSYILTSTAVGVSGSKYVSFELSHLANGFLKESYNGSPNSSRADATVWMDYQLTKTVSGAPSTDALVQNVIFDGYTFFENGLNAQYSEAALITSDVITKLADAPIELGLNSNITSAISFFSNGELINTKTIASSNLSSEQINYATNGYDDAERFELRVLAAGGTFKDNACLRQFECDVDIFPCDKINVVSSDGSVKVMNVVTLEETQHTPHKITFVNKFGALESLWFYGNSKEMIKTNSSNYNRDTSDYTNGGAYNTYDAAKIKVNNSSVKEMQINSGFYPETSNPSFEELILSTNVWIEYNNQVLPIIIKNSSFSFKTHINDKAINYTLDIEFAFNRINNI